MASLKGKVALITGGTKGIGAALAERLSNLGASVAINYASDAKSAEAMAAKLNDKSPTIAVQGNAGTVAGVESIVKTVVDKWGKIDILVPNAGVLPMKTLESTSEADFDQAYALNVKGPYFLCQKAVPYMAKGSHILLVSTTQNHASTVAPPYLLYCSTKGAIEQMTRIMAKELASKEISVNAIAPGPTGTDLFFKGKSEEMLSMIAKLNPRNKIGTPEEVADAMVPFCTDATRWVTGQIVRVNGGQA